MVKVWEETMKKELLYYFPSVKHAHGIRQGRSLLVPMEHDRLMITFIGKA